MAQRYAELCFAVPLDRSFTYTIPQDMEVHLGYKVRAPFGRSVQTAWVVETHERPPTGSYTVKAVDKVMVNQALFDESGLALARWMAGYYFAGIGEALDAMLPGAMRPRQREVEAELDDVELAEAVGDDGNPTEDPRAKAVPGTGHGFALSAAQSAAIEQLAAIKQGLAYLYGVTGSGKTEVFLRAAEARLAAGQGVIYLVPEIALTNQVIDDITRRFAGRAAVLHSRLTPSQRLGEWRRIQSGEARLVVGARSAVFAPVQHLGLIILDEEHEGSYKSSSSPRYHARQVAMHRVASEKAVLLMGSATPSVEAWKLMQDGRITALRLGERVSGGRMPTVELASLQGSGALSPRLVEAIRAVSMEGAQTILFLNRRGFSHFTWCQACGEELKCSHCSVPMTYHKSRERLVCHYCGRAMAPPSTCPSCRQKAMSFAGFGTEFIEEEVRSLFPHLRIARLDTDSARRKGSMETTLKDFREGRIDVLLGTQMVAKGLNFPGLKLVGVVLGDAGLHLPDFRAAERTFNLLVQVAGRAGRYRDDGLVIVQAAQPQHPVIVMAAEHRMEEFYAAELAGRRDLGFPPWGRMVRLVFRSPQADKALQAARDFVQRHGPVLAKSARLLGPAECPLAQVNGSYRQHLILVSQRFSELHRNLGLCLQDWKDPSGVYLEIDVDPVSAL